MNRTKLVRWTALLMASAAGLTIGSAAQAQRGAGSTTAAVGQVQVMKDYGPCGGVGMTGTRLPSTGQILCTHTEPDFGAESARLARTGPPAPLPIGPSTMAANAKCYGNGTSGKRVQVIYAFPQGKPYRPEAVTAIRNTYTKEMEGTVRSESRSTGKEIGIRFVMDTPCNAGSLVDVRSVMLSASAGTVNGSQFGQIADELAAKGYNRSDRKYVVFWDGNGAACGIGTLLPIDDEPSPANLHNGYPGQGAVGALALNMAQAYAPCWGGHTETHELFHTLGAVQYSSPRSNGLGHCIDEPDIMCYSEGGVNTRVECPGVAVELLDCNKNDYFNTNPASSSYLFTHWNTANSRFLGEFPATDAMPVTPPSPYESP
jgi:hypothetical protein